MGLRKHKHVERYEGADHLAFPPTDSSWLQGPQPDGHGITP